MNKSLASKWEYTEPRVVFMYVLNEAAYQIANLWNPVNNFSSLAEALILVYRSNIAQTSKFPKAKRVPA